MDPELDEDVLEMLPHRARRHAEDLGDLGIRLPLYDPAENLALAWRQGDLVARLFEQ